MMTIDDRTGSGDLLPYITKLGVPAQLGRLPYGDVSFIGNGPDGMPVGVGIEVKQIHDVLACITDGRFAGHQLPGLVANYTFPSLLIEGRWRADRNSGVLQYLSHRGDWRQASIGSRAFMFKELSGWLFTMEMCGGIRTIRATDRWESAQIIADLYHWWTDKEWDEHRAHLAFDESANGRVSLVKPGLVRRVAKELPGVGWERSKAVADRFSTVTELVLSDVDEWEEIPGIGRTIARKVVRELRGEG